MFRGHREGSGGGPGWRYPGNGFHGGLGGDGRDSDVILLAELGGECLGEGGWVGRRGSKEAP